ncbi:hypothetical protein HHI36_014006 [Cryptolaemus montrouzieri]|uniref:Uncharacterized protein n=1 Tax=Cryptolaemus montrouzieri TaxID=559131 RepID=A0ABD2N2A1_9CUCU
MGESKVELVVSIRQIVSSIPEPDQDFKDVKRKVQCSFESFSKISLNKLKRTIEGLKNKASADEILTSKLLNDSFLIMLNLVNTSLQTGKLPSASKIFVVTPVPKVNNPKTAEGCYGMTGVVLEWTTYKDE